MRKLTVCVSALALAISVLGASPAEAKGKGSGGPEIEQFNESFSEVDEFLSEVCGFTVLVEGNVGGTFRMWDDGRIHVTERGNVKLSNASTGKTITNWWRMNVKVQGTETFNDDGTLTVTFNDKFTGIPERWIDENGKTLIKDAGFARFVGEVVLDLGDPDDPFDDEVIFFTEEVTTHGPHPLLGDALGPEDLCAALAA